LPPTASPASTALTGLPPSDLLMIAFLPVDVTACFSLLQTEHINASLQVRSPTSKIFEPSVESEDTLRVPYRSPIQDLFIGNVSLRLHKNHAWQLAPRWAGRSEGIYERYSQGHALQSSFDFQNRGITICVSCQNSEQGNPYKVQRKTAQLFKDIFNRQNDPSAALQSLFTLVVQYAYYDLLEQSDDSDAAETTFFSYRLIPMSMTGLVIVWVNFVVHLAAMSVTIAIFLSRKRLSLVGSTWQTFAQAQKYEIGDLFSLSSIATDKEVKRFMKERGVDDQVFKLEYEATQRRIVMRRKDKVP
jgi:hypothetical protein